MVRPASADPCLTCNIVTCSPGEPTSMDMMCVCPSKHLILLCRRVSSASTSWKGKVQVVRCDRPSEHPPQEGTSQKLTSSQVCRRSPADPQGISCEQTHREMQGYVYETCCQLQQSRPAISRRVTGLREYADATTLLDISFRCKGFKLQHTLNCRACISLKGGSHELKLKALLGTGGRG
jgi:hypothetical protein